MALLRVIAIGLLGQVCLSLGEPDCSDGECGIDESSLLALRGNQSSGRTCRSMNGHEFECGEGQTCCGNACKAPDDICCVNADNYKFPCHGSCCGNACAAPESKCCKVGEKSSWYPVSVETECRSPTSLIGESSLLALNGKQSSGRTCRNVNGDEFECGEGQTCCGNACKAPDDICCENADNYKFPCHGSCCGNACAAPGSKCCKVGEKPSWYPVSLETECRSPTSEESEHHYSYGTPGGMNHGMYENDFDWNALTNVEQPDCSRVCRGEHGQCYPVKDNGYMGSPCGVLSAGPHSSQGCFFNGPTQTCALCDTNAQHGYCCPTEGIRECRRQN